MLLTSGRTSGRKNAAPIPIEMECYEGEVQPYRKTDYKPMMMIYVHSKKTQPARGWNAADICTHCVYTIPAPRDGVPIPFWGQAVATCRLAGSAPHKSRDVKSNPGPTTHTNNHAPVICVCHKQINKKQTSIRCNHTHNTHWVHLKCTHKKLRQYKPDWRCTIHTLTQNVTTTNHI